MAKLTTKFVNNIKPTNQINTYRDKTLKGFGLCVRYHDLRHTFASYAINSRFFLPIIAKILGHADIKTAEIRPFV